MIERHHKIAVAMWGEEGLAAYLALLSAAQDFAKLSGCPAGQLTLPHAAQQGQAFEDACLASLDK